MHFAQTRCSDCDLVFSNPVAGSDELTRFYESTCYEEHEPDFNPDRPDLEAVVRRRGRNEAEGLRATVLPCVQRGTFFEIGPGFGGLLAGASQVGFDVAGVRAVGRRRAVCPRRDGLPRCPPRAVRCA